MASTNSSPRVGYVACNVACSGTGSNGSVDSKSGSIARAVKNAFLFAAGVVFFSVETASGVCVLETWLGAENAPPALCAAVVSTSSSSEYSS